MMDTTEKRPRRAAVSSVRARIYTIRAAFRSRLWPLPVVAVALAVTLGVGLPILDDLVDQQLPEVLQRYLFSGGPEAARAVLQSISGSLITVTSLTFSLTVVTLQLASSQFSPRLLRTFTSDSFVHGTLALFLGTFSYSLTVLRTVRSSTSTGSEFVPDIAVTVAFLLAIASVVGLVLFLAHLTREIRVESMMRNVHTATSATIRRVIPQYQAPGATDAPPSVGAATAVGVAENPRGQRIMSSSSGFLSAVDAAGLAAAARKSGAVIRLDQRPGASLIAGVPFATVWASAGRAFSSAELEELTAKIGAEVTIGFERTDDQDPAFGFRQLADVAARALSPGTNDPTTAVHVIGHLSSLLCELVGRDLSDERIRDSDGTVRVILARPRFYEFLSIAVSQIRHYGLQDAAVGSRLLALFEEVAWCDRRGAALEALHSGLGEVRESMELHSYTSAEKRMLVDKYEHVRTAVSGGDPLR
ncbi:DUF2254 domain-containing protein [Pseudarthrobacter sp. PH31-O2]|uniref:DUF2254 domain-containing protein n=1 Tax=Pseudarthrobacter sp. PH31-O2 TaxID=3046206 RepID=UPI0024BB774C|nr:DUF2254 domain-containing protein [Pseudarthrobacter sp. PH31-O2]MDJ0351538.1 DUF2254 domain-containing protein [Pseudarthrobacter sp. PH31-O2]